MFRLFASMMALIFLAITPARAQLYTGTWFDPANGGTGFALEQDGTQTFMTWYAYNTNGTPTWYYALLTAVSGSNGAIISGPITAALAPGLKPNLAPTSISTTSVGSATISFTTPAQGTLQLVLNGVQATYSLVRYNTGTINIAGSYAGVQRIISSNCPGGNAAGSALQVTGTFSQSASQIAFSGNFNGNQCNVTGNYSVAGSILVLTSGTLTCTNGLSATLSNGASQPVIPFGYGGVTFRASATYANPSCTEVSVVTLQN